MVSDYNQNSHSDEVSKSCRYEGMQIVDFSPHYVVHVGHVTLKLNPASSGLPDRYRFFQGFRNLIFLGPRSANEYALPNELGLHSNGSKSGLQCRQLQLADHGRMCERYGWSGTKCASTKGGA